ncbi:hypothetical protein NUACC26_080430 [Scytonema sp. NUACC26]
METRVSEIAFANEFAAIQAKPTYVGFTLILGLVCVGKLRLCSCEFYSPKTFKTSFKKPCYLETRLSKHKLN